ncbi:subtilisin-like protease SBT3.17 isoform X2 [Cornus florida]|nr:subtilisin-like protease SBT3.17 isoform X2 [Cornus florida]
MAKSKTSSASHIQALASVLGSEMAAKKAIIYEYTRTINGFAVKLTADQINALLKHPAVLKILPGGTENVAAHVSTTLRIP